MPEDQIDNPNGPANREEVDRLARDFEGRTLSGLEGYFDLRIHALTRTTLVPLPGEHAATDGQRGVAGPVVVLLRDPAA